jgi:hypothetical protein
VVRRELLERVYRWPLRVTTHPGPGPDAGSPQVTPLAGGLPPPAAAGRSISRSTQPTHWTEENR